MQRPTNFATLFHEKVMEEVAAQQVKEDRKSKEEGKEPKEVDQYAVRKDNLRKLHEHMDKQIDKRKHRLRHAPANKDTTTQWDLLAASSEEAVIDFLQLQGKEASKMRGRSKVVFKKKGRNTLEGMEDQDDSEDLVNRAKWLRQLAGYHSKLGN